MPIRLIVSAAVLTVAAFTQPVFADDTITILSPNGGEVLTAGDEVPIVWSEDVSSNGYVDVSLYKDGVFYAAIASDYLGEESIAWVVCDEVANGDTYTIHLAARSFGVPVEDVSDAPFTITGSTPPPDLDVAYPNGGETLLAGTVQRIHWTSDSATGFVDAWLVADGVEVAFIGSALTGAGHMEWRVSSYLDPAPAYTLRLNWIRSCGPVVEAFSDAPFTIVGGQVLPTLTVTSPVGGEVWSADTLEAITWSSTDPRGAVEVWVTDGGTHYLYVGSAPMADGIITWPILPCERTWDEAWALVRWSDGTRSVEDLSDAPFATTNGFDPEFTITYPSGGESLAAGDTETITWTSTAENGMVDVELLRSGQMVTLLGRVSVSAGAFDWDLCPGYLGGSGYTVRLRLSDCAVSSESASFTIAAAGSPALDISGPTAGAVWPLGSRQTVTWNSANLNGNVELYLPDHVGIHWGHVSVPVEEGSYTWTLPTTLPPADNHKVRIRHSACGVALSDSVDVSIVSGTSLIGDADADGDVDLRDYARLQMCFTDTPALLTPPCEIFDTEPDADTDLRDYWVWTANLTGPEGALPGDDSVHLADLAAFEDCLAGPAAMPQSAWSAFSADCRARFDYDADGDLDAMDFEIFQQRFSGE